MVVWSALCGACGGGGGSSGGDGGIHDVTGDADAGQDYCWPPRNPTPHGTVELGQGGSEFLPLPDTIHLEYGLTAGFFVTVKTRMSGFLPGVASDPSPSTNPFTRIRAELVDSSAHLAPSVYCGYRNAYVANAAGSYDYNGELSIGFDRCWLDSLVGKKIAITAELMDATGNYAGDTKVVTLADSLAPGAPNVTTSCGL